jgi:hypothetical protein
LNKKATTKLEVKKGGLVSRTEVPDGALQRTPLNQELTRQMLVAEEIMNQDREILKVLAKSDGS